MNITTKTTKPPKMIDKDWALLVEIASNVKQHVASAADQIIQAGSQLLIAHQKLANHGNGHFVAYVETECAMSAQTARRFMQVAKSFKDCNTVLQSFDPTALYVLAAPNCPKSARAEAIKLAGKGEHISPVTAKRIRNEHKFRENARSDGPAQWTTVELPATEEPEEWDLETARAKFDTGFEKLISHMHGDNRRMILIYIKSQVQMYASEYVDRGAA